MIPNVIFKSINSSSPESTPFNVQVFVESFDMPDQPNQSFKKPKVLKSVQKDVSGGISDSVMSLLKSNLAPVEKRPSTETHVPDMGNLKVDGNYKHDLDILAIHEKVLRWFKWLKTGYYQQLQTLLAEQESFLNQAQNVIQRKHTLYRIGRYKEEMLAIDNDVKYHEYMSKCKPYILGYRKLGTLTRTISFEDKISTDDEQLIEDTYKQDERHRLITGYLMIVRRYISIDIIHEMAVGKRCQACDFPMDDAIEDQYGNIVCTNCNNEEITIKKMQLSSDTNKISNSRNNYEDRENFKKAIRRFQGIQNNKPPESLYAKLDDYFKAKAFPAAAKIKARPLDEQGRKKGTSRELMYKALHETKNSSFYEDINLILHQYWGWALPDISHLEERIMDDYDLTQSIYDEIPKTRKSCLNSQFRLLKHLLRYKDQINYSIRIQDFKIPTTRDIIEWHEETWDKICSLLQERGYTDWLNTPIL